jgi:hypothetical protein
LDVLRKIVEPPQTALVSALILDLFDTPKLSVRCKLCFLRRHSCRDVCVRQSLEMLAHLLGHLCLKALLAKESKPATKDNAQPWHL